MWFKILTATGDEYIEADMVREVSYEPGTANNHQPSIVFYKNSYPTRDNVVAQYVLKNIGGYRLLRADELLNNRPLLK